MASLFSALGGGNAEVLIRLDDTDHRKFVEVKGEKEQIDSCPVYLDGEVSSLYFNLSTYSQLSLPQTVKGEAAIRVPGGKSVKHDGIKVEFVGAIGACGLPSFCPSKPDSGPKSSSTTEATNTNSYPKLKPSRLPESSGPQRPSPSSSVASRRPMRAIMASM